jgi:hypothetical protein
MESERERVWKEGERERWGKGGMEREGGMRERNRSKERGRESKRGDIEREWM